MRINGELYADGALVANNPTGVAIHETKKLFPNVPLEVVVRTCVLWVFSSILFFC